MPWTNESAIEFLEERLITWAASGRRRFERDPEKRRNFFWWEGKADWIQGLARSIPNIRPDVLRDFVTALQTAERESDEICDENTDLELIVCWANRRNGLPASAEEVCLQYIRETQKHFGWEDVPPRRHMS